MTQEELVMFHQFGSLSRLKAGDDARELVIKRQFLSYLYSLDAEPKFVYNCRLIIYAVLLAKSLDDVGRLIKLV